MLIGGGLVGHLDFDDTSVHWWHVSLPRSLSDASTDEQLTQLKPLEYKTVMRSHRSCTTVDEALTDGLDQFLNVLISSNISPAERWQRRGCLCTTRIAFDGVRLKSCSSFIRFCVAVTIFLHMHITSVSLAARQHVGASPPRRLDTGLGLCPSLSFHSVSSRSVSTPALRLQETIPTPELRRHRCRSLRRGHRWYRRANTSLVLRDVPKAH